ncbi:MAG: hypothetical protein AB1762_02930 [Gemmatimonadota bacterium]
MLNHAELSDMSRALRDERLLSVYVDASVSDPKDRGVWRVALDHQLKSIRQNLLGTSHDERELFETCVGHLDRALGGFQASLSSLGWVGFIASDGVRHSEAVPVAMPTLASWRKGPRIAPYIRALKLHRPVVVVMADTRDATVYRYAQGTLEAVAELHARTFDEEPIHMSKTARAGYHTGVRGVAGKDETGREVEASSKRLISEVTERAAKAAGQDGWLLAGGIPEMSTHIAQSLQSTANGRVRHVPGLDIHATDAQIVVAAQEGASSLRDDYVSSILSDLVDRQVARDMAAFGLSRTEQVLHEKRVRDLFLTDRFIEQHAREAEDAVRSALDQSATVEEVSGMAAAQLDQLGGIGARLRFSLTHSAAS